MKNGIHIKAMLSTNRELELEFYDDKIQFIGNITVSSQGKVIWSIADINYESYIMPIINYIVDDNNTKRLYYETKDEKIERWQNAWNYVLFRGLSVNLMNDQIYSNNTKIKQFR